MNILSGAVTWLQEKRRAHMSDTVIYARGESSVSIKATPCIQHPSGDVEGSNLFLYEGKDFITCTADLVIDNTPVLPESGDHITHNGQVYEVLPTVDSSMCYSFTDPYEDGILIHTKLISGD
jgi:hypothetical protein